MKVKIKFLKEGVKKPSYAHPGDAGLDLYSLENYILRPGERKIFDLGFALEFDSGLVGIIKDKGGVAKAGIHTMGGVFDAGYRGEYNVQLINLSDKVYDVRAGDKLAQLVILPVIEADLEEVEVLEETGRGEGRFGSTGRN